MSKCYECENKLEDGVEQSAMDNLVCHGCQFCELPKLDNFKKKKRIVKKWRLVSKNYDTGELALSAGYFKGDEVIGDGFLLYEKLLRTEKTFEE